MGYRPNAHNYEKKADLSSHYGIGLVKALKHSLLTYRHRKRTS
jgi:hypothetical protein